MNYKEYKKKASSFFQKLSIDELIEKLEFVGAEIEDAENDLSKFAFGLDKTNPVETSIPENLTHSPSLDTSFSTEDTENHIINCAA